MIEYGRDYPDPYAEEDLVLLTTEQLKDIPTKDMLVNSMLTKDSLAWVIGPPGSYKSFFAMDLALSVASGVQFYSRAVKQAPTVYVTGEGRAGLYARVQAWKQGRESEDLAWWHPEGVHVLGEWWPRLVQKCIDVQAGLIVFDTQSNMTAGMDENSAQEMSQWVSALQKLQKATGACVVVVHHPNKAGESMRGSTLMQGAADTVISLVRHSEQPLAPSRVSNVKQKDLPQFDSWWVQPLPTGDSIVLAECAEPAG